MNARCRCSHGNHVSPVMNLSSCSMPALNRQTKERPSNFNRPKTLLSTEQGRSAHFAQCPGVSAWQCPNLGGPSTTTSVPTELGIGRQERTWWL